MTRGCLRLSGERGGTCQGRRLYSGFSSVSVGKPATRGRERSGTAPAGSRPAGSRPPAACGVQLHGAAVTRHDASGQIVVAVRHTQAFLIARRPLRLTGGATLAIEGKP